MNIISLLMAFSLVIVALGFSRSQKLKLEKEIIVGIVRAVVQLTVIGLILETVFGLENPWVTTLLVTLMIFNASRVAAERGRGIHKVYWVSFGSIFVGAWLTLGVLLLVGALKFQPNEVIPVSGMIIGNAMVAVGITFKQLKQNFKDKAQEVEIKLSLGATDLGASADLIRDAVRTGVFPTVDSMKSLGIVHLPGMMTGLILAGATPVMAIQYQIMVTFMLLSTVAISTFLAGYTGYRTFFNHRHQLVVRD